MFSVISKNYAHMIYDILIEFCGAPKDKHERVGFVYSAVNGEISEYRICFAFGFGGKFWNMNDMWYVNCYNEDRNTAIDEKIKIANQELAALKRRFLKEGK